LTSGSLQAYRPYLALCLVLTIGISSAEAADEVAADAEASGLYRIQDGVLVIGWSPEVGSFSAGEGTNLSVGGRENFSLNASLATPKAENSSSDLIASSAYFSLDEGGADGSRLGWASRDPQTDGSGRHAEYGRRVTDLVGVFSIEMMIRLGSNVSSSPETAEWMPCL